MGNSDLMLISCCQKIITSELFLVFYSSLCTFFLFSSPISISLSSVVFLDKFLVSSVLTLHKGPMTDKHKYVYLNRPTNNVERYQPVVDI